MLSLLVWSHFLRRTGAHFGGKCSSYSPETSALHAAGNGGLGAGFGASWGWNHQSSEASQPSPGGTGDCPMHSGAPAGQLSRTWKWSSWPYQGRIL